MVRNTILTARKKAAKRMAKDKKDLKPETPPGYFKEKSKDYSKKRKK
jgi:hypothetical protein